jgi:hypothetical protein
MTTNGAINTSSCNALKMKATCSSETLVHTQENTSQQTWGLHHRFQTLTCRMETRFTSIFALIADGTAFQTRLTASLVASPLTKTFLRQRITTNPALTTQDGKNIHTNKLQRKETFGASLRKEEGNWNRYQAVSEGTLVQVLQQTIFRGKYYLKVQSTS